MTDKNDKPHSKKAKDEPIELVFTVHQELALESEQPPQPSHEEGEACANSNAATGASVHNLHATQTPPIVINNSEVDVLEAQVKLIALYTSEAKLLEAQMNKLIKGAYSKAPNAKPYLLQMKKTLRDFAQIQTILNKAKELNSKIIEDSSPSETQVKPEVNESSPVAKTKESGTKTPKLVKDLELEVEETSLTLSSEGLNTKSDKQKKAA